MSVAVCIIIVLSNIISTLILTNLIKVWQNNRIDRDAKVRVKKILRGFLGYFPLLVWFFQFGFLILVFPFWFSYSDLPDWINHLSFFTLSMSIFMSSAGWPASTRSFSISLPESPSLRHL